MGRFLHFSPVGFRPFQPDRSEERNVTMEDLHLFALHPSTPAGQVLEDPRVGVFSKCSYRSEKPFWITTSRALVKSNSHKMIWENYRQVIGAFKRPSKGNRGLIRVGGPPKIYLSL